MNKLNEIFYSASEYLDTIDKAVEEAIVSQQFEHNIKIKEMLRSYNVDNKTNFTSWEELENHLDIQRAIQQEKLNQL
ncbi:hypothetical protein JHW46_04975 [Vibrio splendidus]|nr:hypothetical protein [Vibrio splendidus]